MKKFKQKLHKTKSGIGSNRILMAALAGAVTGLALTYLLETEKGRSLMSSLAESAKGLAANLKLPGVTETKA